MVTLRGWWRRVTGKDPEVTAQSTKPTERPVIPAQDLRLADEPQPRKPGNIGAGGFDPYSSDAGYSKPHSWERVDHD